MKAAFHKLPINYLLTIKIIIKINSKILNNKVRVLKKIEVDKMKESLFKEVRNMNIKILTIIVLGIFSFVFFTSYALFTSVTNGKSISLTYTGNFEFEQEFVYRGNYEEFVVPKTGYYYMEANGAQGGSYNTAYYGGNGGGTSGYILLNKGEKLYIYVRGG